ncbi:MAG: hypothetical protein V4689_07740 [Verrucomicrobiota bacterium]
MTTPIVRSLDCGSVLPLSVASLLARGIRSRLRDKSGSRLPQSKLLRSKITR